MKQLELEQFEQAIDGKHLEQLNKTFAMQQPHLALTLLQEYGRVPKTAPVVYAGLVTSEGADSLPVVSQELVAELLTKIKADRDSMAKELAQAQEPLTTILNGGYGYVPLPALLVYFGLQRQIQVTSDELAKMVGL